MKALDIVFLAVFATICQAANGSDLVGKPDYLAVTQQALKVLSRQEGTIVAFVPPDDAEPNLIAALESLGKVVPRTQIPHSTKYTLPKGYFVIEYIHIKDGIGHFRGIAGPGALKGTLGADEDCGSRYYISFWFKDGKWENGPYSKQDCKVD